MNEATLKALKASIEHWEQVVNKEKVTIGRETCPLCRLFFSDDGILADACEGCPVYDRTGSRFCEDTPYDDVATAWEADVLESSDRFITAAEISDDTVECAKTELDFLKSLLPS